MSTQSLPPIVHGQTSHIIRIWIGDSTTTGSTLTGKTGLTSSSSGLTIALHHDNANTGAGFAHLYLQSVSTIEAVSSIGTYSTPTATKCRFGEVSATYLPGWYEIHFPDTAWSFSSAKYAMISVFGVSGIAGAKAIQPLWQVNPYNAVRFGMTALPNAAAEASGGLFTRGTGAGQINQAANGQIDANAIAISGDSTAADNLETMLDGTGGNTLSLGSLDITASGTTDCISLTCGTSGRAIDIAGPSSSGETVRIAGHASNGSQVVSITGANADADGMVISGGSNADGLHLNGVYGLHLIGSTTDLLLSNGTHNLAWLAAWDAEVQSECADALTAYGAATSANVSAVETDTQDIQSRLPAALVSGRMDSNTQAMATGVITAAVIATDAIDADAIAANAVTEIQSGLSTLTTGDIDTRLAAIGLDHLVSASVTGTDIADDSIVAKLVSKSATADWDSFANTTDSLEALRDRGDAAWVTATGFSTHSAADVWAAGTRTLTAIDEDSTTLDLDATIRTAIGLASANLDTQIADIPTVSEFNARTIPSADYFDPAADTVANVTTVATTTNLTNLPAITANWLTAAGLAADAVSEIQSGLSTLTAAQVNAECDTAIADAALATAANLATVAGYLDTEIASILADTSELQTDWANGGRLDLILDARASQTSVDDLPTNAELATALGTADDATLAAIAALSIPTANANADALLDRASAIDGKTPRETLRIIAASTAGEVSGAGTATEVFKGLDGATTRMTVTADEDGNRTDVTYG